MGNLASQKELVRHLKTSPLMGNFQKHEIVEIAKEFKKASFDEGTVVIKEGERAKSFYIVLEGKLEVYGKLGSGEERHMAFLSRGDFFGEQGIMQDTRRMASVKVIGKGCQCLELGKEDFIRHFKKAEESKAEQDGHFPRRAGVRGMCTNDLVTALEKASSHPKAESVRKWLYKVLRKNNLFEDMDSVQIAKAVDCMAERKIKKDDLIIKQGDVGVNVFVLYEGRVEIDRAEGGKEKRLAEKRKGKVFGELSLLHSCPRTASVKALTDCIVYVIDRFTFRSIQSGTSIRKLADICKFLSKVELLAAISISERKKIAEAMVEVQHKKGDVICRKGEKGNSMYIVHSGRVRTCKDGKDVASFKTGDYFGERCLLLEDANHRRGATCTADDDCVLLRIDAAAVELLLGPVKHVLQARAESTKSIDMGDDMRASRVSAFKDTERISRITADWQKIKKERKVELKDLERIGYLGKGAFGFVSLVTRKGDKTHTYALKAISKQRVVETKQETHTAQERSVLLELHHPCIVRLYGTQQDKKCIYFLLEPCLGGDLFTLLRTRKLFDEPTARFYAATVADVWHYMHSLDIIYRDLKPENLLLDSKGFLKVTDFGFAKEIEDFTYTMCGTPDYLAPEVIQGKGHGKGVDWWTLGVLIYELLAGYPPFYSRKQMRIYVKILHANLHFPAHFTKDARSIIDGLLTKRQSERLGVTHGGSESVKAHPFFKDFDFDGLLEGSMKPPIEMKTSSTTDLTHFKKKKEKEFDPPKFTGSNEWCKDF